MVIPPFLLNHQNHVHNWPHPRFRPQPVFHSSNYPWARAHRGVGLFVPCQHWWGRWRRFDWSTQTRRTHIYPFLFPLKDLDQQQRCGANVEATDTRTRQCRRWDCLLDRTNQEHRLLAFCKDYFHIPGNQTITPPQLTALVIFILVREWGRKSDQAQNSWNSLPTWMRCPMITRFWYVMPLLFQRTTLIALIAQGQY